MQTWTVGRPVQDLDTPALLLDLDVMERNIARMAETFRRGGVGWRPHTKALKTPAFAHILLRAGAHGITCAKLGEAEIMAAGGVRDILIANQIVGDQKIARLVNLLPHADVIVAVDGEPNVRALDQAAQAKGVRLRVVVEVNIGMNRAGVEPGDAVRLATLVHDSPGLRLAGLMAWEAHTVTIADPEEKRRAILQAVGLLVDTAERLRAADLPVDIVSCGGTGTYETTAFVPGVTEIQAGGGILGDVHYRTHYNVDHAYALTVLATVTSRPTPGRIICDTGKKTMSSDAAVPEPIGVPHVARVGLSAEHAKIELSEPDASIRVGDKIRFVVGYSDTTVHLHDEIYGVRNDAVEIVWPLWGRGRLR